MVTHPVASSIPRRSNGANTPPPKRSKKKNPPLPFLLTPSLLFSSSSYCPSSYISSPLFSPLPLPPPSPRGRAPPSISGSLLRASELGEEWNESPPPKSLLFWRFDPSLNPSCYDVMGSVCTASFSFPLSSIPTKKERQGKTPLSPSSPWKKRKMSNSSFRIREIG